MSRERLIVLQALIEGDNDLVNAGRKLSALYLNEGQRYASSAPTIIQLITSNIAATVSFVVCTYFDGPHSPSPCLSNFQRYHSLRRQFLKPVSDVIAFLDQALGFVGIKNCICPLPQLL